MQSGTSSQDLNIRTNRLETPGHKKNREGKKNLIQGMSTGKA